MLAVIALALLLASPALFWTLLRLGIYRRIPIEQYVLLAVSAGLGLYAFAASPSLGNGAVAFLAVAFLAFVVWWVHFGGAAFPRQELALNVGDHFPEFALPDSTGTLFRSSSMIGVGSALYLFYRGDW